MGMTGVAMGVSALSSIGTSYAQSEAIKAQGDYQAGIADTNAKLANITAAETLEAGDIVASRKNLETRGAVGSIRARQGASGIDVASGSSALTRIGTEFAGRTDELTIKNNAARQAWGYKVQAINDSYAGQFSKMTAASNAQQTLLTGGLKAISGPLGIYANAQYLQRRYGAGLNDQPYFSTAEGPSPSGVPIGRV